MQQMVNEQKQQAGGAAGGEPTVAAEFSAQP
jgi:hypothetical protein